MKEIICPKCKRIQLISKNKLCTYCFYDFNKIENLEDNKKESFPIDYNNLEDSQIVEYLKIDKIKPHPSKLISTLFSVLVIGVSFIIFIIEKKIFVFSETFGFIEKFTIALSIVTTITSYRYLNKKYNIDNFVDEVFTSNYRYKEATLFEKKIYFALTFFFFNIIVLFMNIYALNDISSIIAPSQKIDVFVLSKNSTRVKNGYHYYVTMTNWKRNSNSEITLSCNNKNDWENIQTNTKAQLKIKRGLLSEVIWSFKQ